MKCFKCKARKTKTIYPKGHVQKMCTVCGWKSHPLKIPEPLDRFKENKGNIYDKFEGVE